ncbi:bifunctional 2-polyprenyl-6-hydroxyphenol methylase/3-demethylubiquinol 3-O-methyltransferase UbiG [Bradyrhizobium sp. IAR9]|uniref:class I SAM-dependent methyltransferase n=1 Tax=Bradyrhizobium sp. IAR9 TaxID=2663841 RepID=UPI0024BF9AA5|nr:class I SAM-dependent methyltransferase [Bradyrhizobium sp. IAR9]
MIRYRSDICPPWPLYEHICQGASVLDVGCGMGAQLITLAALGRISSGYGVDVSSKAVAQAALAAKYYPQSNLTFQVMDSIDDVPQKQFDVAMMIDVMHHIPLEHRNATFAGCIKRVKPCGLFIYKDMADEPSLNAFVNRLHDLVIAREIVEYLPLEAALEWAANFDLQLILRSQYTKLFYRHELLVFRKP